MKSNLTWVLSAMFVIAPNVINAATSGVIDSKSGAFELVDTASNRATARKAIDDQRAAVLRAFDLADLACDKRFMRTDCVNAAKHARREKLDDLRRQEVALNDADRRDNAALAQSRVDERRSPAALLEAATREAQARQDDLDRRERATEKAQERAEAAERAAQVVQRMLEAASAAASKATPVGASVGAGVGAGARGVAPQSPREKAEATLQKRAAEAAQRQERAVRESGEQARREQNYAQRKTDAAQRLTTKTQPPAADLPTPPAEGAPIPALGASR